MRDISRAPIGFGVMRLGFLRDPLASTRLFQMAHRMLNIYEDVMRTNNRTPEVTGKSV